MYSDSNLHVEFVQRGVGFGNVCIKHKYPYEIDLAIGTRNSEYYHIKFNKYVEYGVVPQASLVSSFVGVMLLSDEVAPLGGSTP